MSVILYTCDVDKMKDADVEDSWNAYKDGTFNNYGYDPFYLEELRLRIFDKRKREHEGRFLQLYEIHLRAGKSSSDAMLFATDQLLESNNLYTCMGEVVESLLKQEFPDDTN